MRRVVWTARARDGLHRIEAYIALFKPRAGARLAERLIAVADSLVDLPERGREVAGGVCLIAAVRPYLLRYRVVEATVIIPRVRHAARRRR